MTYVACVMHKLWIYSGKENSTTNTVLCRIMVKFAIMKYMAKSHVGLYLW